MKAEPYVIVVDADMVWAGASPEACLKLANEYVTAERWTDVDCGGIYKKVSDLKLVVGLEVDKAK